MIRREKLGINDDDNEEEEKIEILNIQKRKGKILNKREQKRKE